MKSRKWRRLVRGGVATLGTAAVLAATPAVAEDPKATGNRDVVVAEGRRPLGHSDFAYTFGIGAFDPAYAPPAAGSYELPPIDRIGDHAVVDAQGNRTTLSKVIDGRLAVVSFIYASCAEATGCPMATAVLHRLDASLAADPGLDADVALVTISFDPARDTPERLAAMQKHRAKGSSWQFVTAPDEDSLPAILDDFGQTVARLRYPDGTWTGVYRHVLKVFLVDRRSRVRNVYSVGFLHPELVRADIDTLRMEEGATRQPH